MPMQTQKGGGGIAPPNPFVTSVLERSGMSAPCPGCFTPRKDMVATIQEDRWALGLFRKAIENLAPSGIQSLDCPAHSDSLYQLC